MFGGDMTGFTVCGEHLCDRRRRCSRGEAKHLLYCTRDTKEGDSTFEEGVDGNLVRRIQGDAV